MKLSAICEAITEEQMAKYKQWVSDCKRADPNATVTGGISGAQAVNWVDAGNRVVGDWDGKTMSGVVYPSGSQDSTRMDEQAYVVGDKVLTKIGGKWIEATITKPPHKETGNYGVRARIGKTVINTVSSPEQLKKP